MIRLPFFVAAALMAGGLRQHVLGVAYASRQHRKERERDLWMALEDPAEVPALDAKRRRRLHRADRRGTRELVEEGHLAEDLPRPKRRELGLLAAAVLNDVDLARADDERAHAGVALPHDVLPGFVALLDCGVRDGLERFLVEILEHRDAFQEVDARRRHGR